MKNKPIYTIMDTDKLSDYISSNLGIFGLETDANGIKIPDHVRDATIAVVVSSATDGQLAAAIDKVFSNPHNRAVLDRVHSLIDYFVHVKVVETLKQQRYNCVVPASVTLQRWVHDYAETVNEIEFDCQLALNGFQLSDLPPYADWFHDRGWCCHGDDLFFASEEVGLIDGWDGPFEFYIADDDAYEAYMGARVKDEYGCELRE